MVITTRTTMKLATLLASAALLGSTSAHIGHGDSSSGGSSQKPILPSWQSSGCLPGPIAHDEHPSCLDIPPESPEDYNPTKFHPWTHRPFCPAETPYCVYTNSKFQSRGVSVIAMPFSVAKERNDTTTIRSLEVLLASDALTKAPSPAEPTDRPYEIRDIPGKGKGVVATRKIPRGTVLMVEHAAVIADMVFPVRVRRVLGREMLRRAMSRVGKEGEEAILDLARSSHMPMEVPAAEDVMKTNAFTVKVAGKNQMALFPRVARINHSCRPNALTKFDEQALTMTVRAIRDIEAGTEINLSYTDFGLTFHERQTALKAKWGFDCTCTLCSASPSTIAASDARRKKINELGTIVIKHVENQDFKQAIKQHHEMMETIEEENLAPHMGDYYEVMTRLLAATKDMKKAKKYARLAIDEFGTAGETKRELEAFLKVA